MVRILSVLSLSLAVATLSAGCSAESSSDDTSDPENDSAELRGNVLSSDRPTPVTLNFEGTCEFLRQCSTFSRNPPQPNMVQWGCEGWKVCSDDDVFLAAPKRLTFDGRTVPTCGMRIEVCRPDGSRCVTAIVRDVSDRSVWEASPGVLDALDLPHGLTSRCSGYGGGRVTIKAL